MKVGSVRRRKWRPQCSVYSSSCRRLEKQDGWRTRDGARFTPTKNKGTNVLDAVDKECFPSIVREEC